MNPLVSVIIPAFNSEKFIAEALDSVFAQTYRPIEVIVIDDGSTDRTAEVVNGFIRLKGLTASGSTSETNKTGNTSLTYLHQKNCGPSASRNAGIKAARGEYIAFLDADDTWTEGKIEKQLKLFEKDASIAVVFCNAEVIKIKDGKSDTFSFFERHGLSEDFFGHEYLVVNPCVKFLKINFMLTPTVIARRSCFHNGMFFNEGRRHAEDWELWLRMALVYRFGYVAGVCVCVKDLGDGLCAESDQMLRSRIEVLEDFLRNNLTAVVSRMKERELATHLKEIYKWAGYHFMMVGNNKLARKYLVRALKQVWDMKTALYYLGTFVQSHVRHDR